MTDILIKILGYLLKLFTCGSSYTQTVLCTLAKCDGHLNLLTTEFFPPRQHISMHSVHTTFVGAPLPQHSLLSGQTWWGSHTRRAPSGNTVNDIHDPTSPAIGGQKVDLSWILAPKLGPDLTDGTPYTINLHVFLRTRLVQGACQELPKFLGVSHKVVLDTSKAI